MQIQMGGMAEEVTDHENLGRARESGEPGDSAPAGSDGTGGCVSGRRGKRALDSREFMAAGWAIIRKTKKKTPIHTHIHIHTNRGHWIVRI